MLRDVSNGLQLGPNSGLSVAPQKPITGALPLPTRIAPAASARSAKAQKISGLKSRSARMPPNVAGQPGLTSNRSLIAAGTPCSSPSSPPPVTARSASRAASRAPSKSRYTSALRPGLRTTVCRYVIFGRGSLIVVGRGKNDAAAAGRGSALGADRTVDTASPSTARPGRTTADR